MLRPLLIAAIAFTLSACDQREERLSRAQTLASAVQEQVTETLSGEDAAATEAPQTAE